MSKVLVDRDVLVKHVSEIDSWNASMEKIIGKQPDYRWASLETLRETLAQPAEAEVGCEWEWLKLAAEVAEEDGPWEPRLGMTDCETAFAQSASPTKVLELIAALSAVTAERDQSINLTADYIAMLGEAGLQIDQLTAERDALAARLGEWERSKLAQIMRENVELTAERDRLESVLIRTTTRHFAQQWKDRVDDKNLDECLSEGIAMLEAERDQLRAEVGALRGHLTEQPTFTVGTDLSDGKLTVVVMKHKNDISWVIHSEVTQIAEQQPTPDVTQLVEALHHVKLTDEEARHHSVSAEAYWNNAVTACMAALATYRKQGGA